jgi:hypothetical protein
VDGSRSQTSSAASLSRRPPTQHRTLGRLHRRRDPRTSYIDTIQAAGFELDRVRGNNYQFVSERALSACTTYEVESISLAATKRA